MVIPPLRRLLPVFYWFLVRKCVVIFRLYTAKQIVSHHVFVLNMFVSDGQSSCLCSEYVCVIWSVIMSLFRICLCQMVSHHVFVQNMFVSDGQSSCLCLEYVHLHLTCQHMKAHRKYHYQHYLYFLHRYTTDWTIWVINWTIFNNWCQLEHVKYEWVFCCRGWMCVTVY